MCAVPGAAPASARIAVVSPPGAGGEVDAAVLAACAMAGVDEVYAVGGAQAIAALAYGTETIARGRRDRRPGQPLRHRGEAPGLRGRRHRRPRRAERARRRRRRRRRCRTRSRSTCSPRPSTARTARWSSSRPTRRLLDEVAARVDGARRRAAERRRRAARARRGPRVSRPRSRSPTPTPPSTSSSPSTAPTRRAAAERVAGCVFVGPGGRDRVRRLRRRLEPRPADRRRARGSAARSARGRSFAAPP